MLDSEIKINGSFGFKSRINCVYGRFFKEKLTALDFHSFDRSFLSLNQLSSSSRMATCI
jgi:hypothetical protein